MVVKRLENWFLALCVLCTLSASTPLRAGEFVGAHPAVTAQTPGVVYQNGRDGSVDGHGTVVPARLDEWAAHPDIEALFISWGWDGVAFGPDGLPEFEYLRQHVAAAGRQSMLRDLWDAAGQAGLRDFGTPEQPVPAPIAVPFKSEVEKALRAAGTEFHEGIKQARADGVATADQEAEFLRRRLALLVALNRQVQALPDDVRPGEPIAPNGEGQAECDALWTYVHEVRTSFASKKLTGYTVDEYWRARGRTGYFISELDTHLFNGLNGMSNVALVLGLRGEWITLTLFGTPRQVRDAYYVDPLQSWSSQDPVARKVGDALGLHSGGLAVGGERN